MSESVEKAFQNWMNMHLSKRKGERLRMLKEQYSEARDLFLKHIWWEVVGHFDDLHPEYEVVDEGGKFYYYLDLAYVRAPKPTNLEFDGFTVHARHIDRRNFSKSRRRQNAIALGGWNILRFSVDDIRDDPAYCRQILRLMLERWYGEEREEWSQLTMPQREIMRLACRSAGPIRVVDVRNVTGLGDRHTRKLLHQLLERGLLEPSSGNERITSYQVPKQKHFKSRRYGKY